ncbi:ABC transporter substrate-binding protein [Microlunatus sp. GCM10028923]|uniref:ABC transporter substrate-binding protein n=1 Tax=Microlunatus sp. GCM10028923 TaxID=3273400 RepID=UPI00361F9865
MINTTTGPLSEPIARAAQSALPRRAVLGGLVAAAAGGLAACGGGTGNPGGGGGKGGVLNVWGGVPPESGPDDLIKAFNEEHPDIKVTYTRYVNDDQGNLKLDTSLQGGVPIDVFFSYSPANVKKRSNLALDITERVAGDPDLATFTADADPIGNYPLDGKLFCVPAALAPHNVYVNASMVEAAGITLPENWSVDEYVEVARKLTVPGKTFGSLNAPTLARATIGSNSNYTEAGKSNFADPLFAKELELALSLQKEGTTMPQSQILAEKLKTFPHTPFIAGRVAMVIQAGHLVRYISDTKEYPHDFKTICMPTPAPEKGKPFWNTGQIGDLMSISAKSKNPDNAWLFLQFWVKNAAKYMIKGGRLPSLVGDAKPADMITQLLGPDRDKLYDSATFQKFLFESDLKVAVDTKFSGATQITQIMEKLTDEVLLGDRTVDSWVTEAVKQADAAITTAP